MAVAALIELESIFKTYQSGEVSFQALRGISFSLAQGEHVAIVGQSGSGKSTLLSILGCLDAPTAGSYRLNGQEVSRMKDEAVASLRNRTIGFVFQSFNLLKRLTVLENVALPALYARTPRALAKRKAFERLEAVGIGHLARRYPSQLSGGQQQRCAIARSLVNDPRLLLADEPTGNLDSDTAKEIVQLIQGLNTKHGLAVVLVTHEPSIAAAAPRVVRVHDGQVAFDGPPLAASAIHSRP